MADPVRPLVAISGVEAVASAALTIVVAIGAARSDLDPVIALTTVAMWLVITALLGLICFGLYRRRRLALTPFLLTQAFALVVAWPMISSDILADRLAGILLVLLVAAGLALGLRESARKALAGTA